MSLAIPEWFGDSSFWFATLAALTFKALLIIAVAGLGVFLTRRASAATRHLIWSLAMCSLLLLPIITALVPSWEISIFRIPESQIQEALGGPDLALEQGMDIIAASPLETGALSSSETTPAGDKSELIPESVTSEESTIQPGEFGLSVVSSNSRRWTDWMLIVWIAGFLIVVFRLMIGFIGVYWLSRHAQPYRIDQKAELAQAFDLTCPVRLLLSDRGVTPMTWGVFRPVVLLPATFDIWSPERQKMVLMHELAHVRRRDYPLQIVAQLVCALYWFIPLVWIISNRMLIEQEAASDDLVIASGIRQKLYAEELLEIAGSLRQVSWSRPVAVAMARTSELETRLQAVLDTKRNRRSVSVKRIVWSIVLVGSSLLPLAASAPSQAVQVGITSDSSFLQDSATGETPTLNNTVVTAAPASPTISAQLDNDGKNRIVISASDHLLLFEYNEVSSEYEIVWQSASTGASYLQGTGYISNPVIADLDMDGDSELIAVDPFGIFVWGEHGIYPDYFSFEDSARDRGQMQIAVADLDGDGNPELITQGRWGGYGEGRQIDVWQIRDSKLFRLTSTVLDGGISWTLLPWDAAGDGHSKIISAASLINIFDWDPNTGLVEAASIPSLSNLNDYVQISDVDNDGYDEMIAVGNSGRVTVYELFSRWGRLDAKYPVLFQSEPLGLLTQGLTAGDIDGDGDIEIVVGVADRSEQTDNIVVFENMIKPENSGEALQSVFKKTFGMTLEGSSIPGLYLGDTDNDGQNEIVFNSKYVLEFSRAADSTLNAEVSQTLIERGYGAAIGAFHPSGPDEPQGLRLVSRIWIEAEGDDRLNSLEAGRTYRLWARLTNAWGIAEDVTVSLEATRDVVEIGNAEVEIGDIPGGTSLNNSDEPFVLRTADVDSTRSFELKLTVTARGGYRQRQTFSWAKGINDERFSLSIQPSLRVSSKTLNIACCGPSFLSDVFASIDVNVDYVEAQYVAFPTIERVTKYRNLVLADMSSIMRNSFREGFQQFVKNGGNVLVHGYNVAQVPDYDSDKIKSEREFVRMYLHVEPISSPSNSKRLSGIDGDVISDGLSFSLADKDYDYRPDIIEPTGDAISLFRYSSGETAAIRYEGDQKLIYLGFRFEDIESEETKAVLMKRILDWFNED